MNDDTQYWRERCIVAKRVAREHWDESRVYRELYHAERDRREAAEQDKRRAELYCLRMCDIVDQYRRGKHG